MKNLKSAGRTAFVTIIRSHTLLSMLLNFGDVLVVLARESTNGSGFCLSEAKWSTKIVINDELLIVAAVDDKMFAISIADLVDLDQQRKSNTRVVCEHCDRSGI